jgi:PAS domain S-box-containing protein
MTERRRLEETRLRLAAIVESSNDGIISTNLDFVIRTWNAAAEKMYGYSADEIIGQSLALLVPKEHRHELNEFRTRINGGGHLRQFETVRIRKDGQKIHVSLNVFPIKDECGKLLGVSIIAHDDTEQRRERLRRDLLIHKLSTALRKVKLLSGLLPVCASCKRVRDAQGSWHDLEQYIGAHSEAKFTHGICPDCRLRLYPETLKQL